MSAEANAAYRQLHEAEATRVHGTLTARHPAGYPLEGLILLRTAARRYCALVRNGECVSFAEWADRIAALPADVMDDDRQVTVAALRAMHAAAQPQLPSRPMSRILAPVSRFIERLVPNEARS